MRVRPLVALVAAGALLGACVAPPVIATGPSPADASVRVPALAYQPVTGGVKTFRPVEPKGWEELNRQVTPKGN
ncbi:hypothetical protein [Bosea sp. CRIB-10]|uniref:hypothetical protein n=1 Tax=Bosea sp. CRIB-10 TaxID=378404 RepID=UPI000B876CA1|nr:hypothetical protein [Bosea sp. CRIB-10]